MITFLLIDGENFRKSLSAVFFSSKKDSPQWHEYDFRGLLDKALSGIIIDRKIFYFARLKIHPSTEEKSRKLVEEQRLLKTSLERQGFEVVLAGMVRGQMVATSWLKGGSRLVFKEKGVDVRIAVDMVVAGCDKIAETIILGSSDSDLQPAVHETRKRGIKCVYLGFEDQPNKGLTATTDKTILIRNTEVLGSGSAILPLTPGAESSSKG